MMLQAYSAIAKKKKKNLRYHCYKGLKLPVQPNKLYQIMAQVCTKFKLSH